MTWYRLYKDILCPKLGIVFPLKQSELSIRVNKIPEDLLVFHKHNANNNEVDSELNSLSKVYFASLKDIGVDRFYNLDKEIPEFNFRCDEYPERRINILTFASILYISGYKGDKLYERIKESFGQPKNQDQSN